MTTVSAVHQEPMTCKGGEKQFYFVAITFHIHNNPFFFLMERVFDPASSSEDAGSRCQILRQAVIYFTSPLTLCFGQVQRAVSHSKVMLVERAPHVILTWPVPVIIPAVKTKQTVVLYFDSVSKTLPFRHVFYPSQTGP